jgi:hypothetical protein
MDATSTDAPAVLAAARLDAYERVARAVAGPAVPPILRLADEQLARLFAPRQLEALVERPLRRAAGQGACGEPAQETSPSS